VSHTSRAEKNRGPLNSRSAMKGKRKGKVSSDQGLRRQRPQKGVTGAPKIKDYRPGRSIGESRRFGGSLRALWNSVVVSGPVTSNLQEI